MKENNSMVEENEEKKLIVSLFSSVMKSLMKNNVLKKNELEEQEEDFTIYRKDSADTFLFIFNILGEQFLFILENFLNNIPSYQLTLNKNNTNQIHCDINNDYKQIETIIFTFTSIIETVDFKKPNSIYTQFSFKLLNFIFTVPSPLFQNLTQFSSTILSFIHSFVSFCPFRHLSTQTLQSTLNFIFSLVNMQKNFILERNEENFEEDQIIIYSLNSIKSIIKYCGINLRNFIDLLFKFLYPFTNINNNQTPTKLNYVAFKTVSHLLSFSEDSISCSQYLGVLCNQIFQKIESVLNFFQNSFFPQQKLLLQQQSNKLCELQQIKKANLQQISSLLRFFTDLYSICSNSCILNFKKQAKSKNMKVTTSQDTNESAEEDISEEMSESNSEKKIKQTFKPQIGFALLEFFENKITPLNNRLIQLFHNEDLMMENVCSLYEKSFQALRKKIEKFALKNIFPSLKFLISNNLNVDSFQCISTFAKVVYSVKETPLSNRILSSLIKLVFPLLVNNSLKSNPSSSLFNFQKNHINSVTPSLHLSIIENSFLFRKVFNNLLQVKKKKKKKNYFILYLFYIFFSKTNSGKKQIRKL